MNGLTVYNIKGRNEHDDGVDSLAMFCKEVIEGHNAKAKVSVFKRPF